MPHIVILDGYTLNPGDNTWGPLQEFGSLDVYDRTSPDQVVKRAGEADILITNKVPITAEAIASLPKVKFIAVLATGFNMVDLDAALSRGIPVSNARTGHHLLTTADAVSFLRRSSKYQVA